MKINNSTGIIVAGVVMNTTLSSVAQPLLNFLGYCIQVTFTGTPTGTFSLEVSADAVSGVAAGMQPYTPTNWTTVTDSEQGVTAAGSVAWNVDAAYYNFVRVVYTDSSGGDSTAVIASATMNSKGPG